MNTQNIDILVMGVMIGCFLIGPIILWSCIRIRLRKEATLIDVIQDLLDNEACTCRRLPSDPCVRCNLAIAEAARTINIRKYMEDRRLIERRGWRPTTPRPNPDEIVHPKTPKPSCE